ncbi:EcsC family protein [Tropicibacter naphthalenivorans]|uniref:EcsC protein family protein n=1 Tax=Tropicibacter naphthalenivorans TaxID=441103 RepID=A0A0P1G219_9RHOB|nr:EcsC family protein [Tropicibacter naphthalenivorans]CUH75783.1 EcsC protein family protein [Tropicibacter naphthalenivorans]SMC42274.1 EcsC protein family protein [Tropicibacter naphthalenivorans]
MTDLTIPIDLEAELKELARRHRAASTVGMSVLNLIGGQAENLLEKLPDSAKDRLEATTIKALDVALRAALKSRGVVPDQKSWLNTALTTAMGAAGGAGGLPSALAELPVTTTVLFRAIAGVAADHGFDPSEPDIAKECLTVFAAAGPLAEDDGADMAFLAARVSLVGSTVHGVIAKIAPRLSYVLGQKLATQAVPVIGAAAGAATNYAYTSYYQQMAHVHFGLLRLERSSGHPRALLIDMLREELSISTKSALIR